MKRGWFLRWGGWFARHSTVRKPSHAAEFAALADLSEAVLREDAETLRAIVVGLNRIQERAFHSEAVSAAEARGYFTPDEDDRVRQALLAYRNYRIASYDIILRLEHYALLPKPDLQAKAFLVAFAAALTLYAKSLQLQQLIEWRPLLCAKLNEPEPKYELAPGFFDDVISGYSSLANYGLILRALWFWSRHRRTIRRLAKNEPEVWGWLEQIIIKQRRTVQRRLTSILRSRLRDGIRTLWKTAFRPAQKIGDELRASVGTRLANIYLHPGQHTKLDIDILARLKSILQVGDVLLMRAEGKLTGAMLPGFWAHAALYLGSGARGETNANMVIEAISPRVRMVPLDVCLDTDHVLVLRPAISRPAVELAIQEAMKHLDKPYDFEFDFNVSSRIVCTELIYRSFHGRENLRFQLVKRLGRYTLSGDDLLGQALDSVAVGTPQTGQLAPTALILRRPRGMMLVENTQRILTLLGRIRRGWRPLGQSRLRTAKRTRHTVLG